MFWGFFEGFLGFFECFWVTFGGQVEVVLEAPLALLGLVRGLRLPPLWEPENRGGGAPKSVWDPPKWVRGPQNAPKQL